MLHISRVELVMSKSKKKLRDVTYGENAGVFAEYLWRSTKRKAHLKSLSAQLRAHMVALEGLTAERDVSATYEQHVCRLYERTGSYAS